MNNIDNMLVVACHRRDFVADLLADLGLVLEQVWVVDVVFVAVAVRVVAAG